MDKMLTDTEKLLLSKVFEGDFPSFNVLGKQINGLCVTERRKEYHTYYAFFDTQFRGLAVTTTTSILAITGYVASDTSIIQSESAQLGIRIASTIIPLIALICCIIVLKFYPLQGERYEKFQNEYHQFLETRRSSKTE